MKEKMLPLLSDGLRTIVENIRDKHHGCDIANELLEADNLVISYNNIIDGWYRYNDNKYLDSILNVAEDRIAELITSEARMLSFRHNAFEISYLPKGKEPKYSGNGVWSRDNRQTSKPARIIQKLLVREFKCKEFEDFSNWIKNEMIAAGEFTLVSGSDITKYYNEATYLEDKGTLSNSCMRYSECSNYFGIYEDHAKLLICKRGDKIMGRAIVWELPKGIYMDRIYTCYDYLEAQFVDYAESQKWYHRENNSLLSDGDEQLWKGPEDNYVSSKFHNLTIHLCKRYDYMPYVDSFRYYDDEENTISTDPCSGRYRLSNTDGSYDDEAEIYECICCGSEGRGYDGEVPDDWVWSEWEDGYLCPDCSHYCDGIDDYIGCNCSVDYAIDDDGVEKLYPTVFLNDSEDFIKINDKWYHVNYDKVVYDEENDSYFLNN